MTIGTSPCVCCSMGEEFGPILARIVQTPEDVFDSGKINVDDSRKPRTAQFDEEKLKEKQFQELWKLINVKTYYRVDFETSELIGKSIDAIDKNLSVIEIRMVVEEGQMEAIVDSEGIEKGDL